MTIDDWIAKKGVNPDNALHIINDCKRSWEGAIGGGYDYQCSPQGLELNGVTARFHPERNIAREFYKWNEVYNYIVRPKQMTLW